MAATKGPAPKIDRPHMPSYGIARGRRGLKSWSWASKAFAASRNYWVSSMHPEGRPHSSAVWGVFLDGKFWFSCAPDSRKAKNLAADPECVVTTERAGEAVIIEGRAEPVRGRAANQRFARAYSRKYDWPMDDLDGDGFFVVTPRVAFAFVEHPDEFGQAATRYTFPRPRSKRARR